MICPAILGLASNFSSFLDDGSVLYATHDYDNSVDFEINNNSDFTWWSYQDLNNPNAIIESHNTLCTDYNPTYTGGHYVHRAPYALTASNSLNYDMRPFNLNQTSPCRT